MDENDFANLDNEFKRYLQIIRPYLSQLTDKDLIDICNGWIQRLSDCKDNEKNLRNKYIFTLCYQLARGILEDPFTKRPDIHQPLSDTINTDDSSSEIEYIVVNPQEDTKVILKPKNPIVSDTEYHSQDNDLDGYVLSAINSFDNDDKPKFISKICEKNTIKHAGPSYAWAHTSKSCMTCEVPVEIYNYRTKNLIMKLREIKTQNMMLHQELCSLREETKMKSGTEDFTDEDIVRVNNTTSTCCQFDVSNSSIKLLRCKLQEAQDSKNNLIQTIITLQENLTSFNEIKKHEIDDLETKFRLEMIEIKSLVTNEIKLLYENKLEEQKQYYEAKILEIHDSSNSEKQSVKITKDNIITDKDKVILGKNGEIAELKSTIEKQKENFNTVLKQSAENPKNDHNSETFRLKAEQLEKRLAKVEKSKAKCIRIYEVKLAQLQQEKYLAECSLQLQLVSQRAQVINEIAVENQNELVSALDKLEAKYKDIVANVQSTAIQRRVQDQIALDSVIETAIKSENMFTNCTRDSNRNQFSCKTMQNQGRAENRVYDSEMSSVLQGNKVGNVIVGNKSFGEDSVIAGYCLDGERLGQLFERVYIPQRDTGDGSLKK